MEFKEMTQSRVLKSSAAMLLWLLVFGLCRLGTAQAQATFQVSGSANVITKIGHTELVGSVTMTVISGTTVAGSVEFFIPNVAITNDLGSGIGIAGTGGLITATIAS